MCELSAEELMFWIVVLEKTLESPWDRKEIKSMNPIGNQFWIFIRRTVAQAEATNTSAAGAKSQLIGIDLDTGKDGGLEEKGVTQDEMVGWHHWLKGHEFQQTLGESEGQGSLACCNPWCHRVRHNLATEQWAIGLCLKWATLSWKRDHQRNNYYLHILRKCCPYLCSHAIRKGGNSFGIYHSSSTLYNLLSDTLYKYLI